LSDLAAVSDLMAAVGGWLSRVKDCALRRQRAATAAHSALQEATKVAAAMVDLPHAKWCSITE
jgi:hypothetical protein